MELLLDLSLSTQKVILMILYILGSIIEIE